jgi:V8-like Glu-specific endopeptidase
MNIQSVIQQATQRAGRGYNRKRDTEEFKRRARNWSAVEKPERVLSRMDQLGLHKEIVQLASAMAAGTPLDAFNPLERIIGQSQLMSSYFLHLGAERARAVGRILTEGGVGFGTGFLISPSLLMTNNHVLEDEGLAARCRVQFDYMVRSDGTIGTTQIYRLVPSEFFLTSLATPAPNLDYTIVGVEPVNSQGMELVQRGRIPLIATSGKLVVQDLANIIQHPGGEPQQVALRDSKVVESLEHFLRYEADTQPGSSGSPVFNDQWQLAALHHSGIPEEVRPGVYRLIDGGEWDTRQPLSREQQLKMAARVKWIANEGVRISSIVRDVRARLRNDRSRLALFEEAVRERVTPSSGIEVGNPPASYGPTTVPPTSAGAVSWTIPLRFTVQFGPEIQLSVSGATSPPAVAQLPTPLSQPAISQPQLPAPPDQALPAGADASADPAVARARELLEDRADILEVRSGYLWQDGRMTDRPAVVVVVDPNVSLESDDPYEELNIPRAIEGTPVDVTVGGPSALLRAAERRGQLAAEALSLADLFQERVPDITYEEPEGLTLEEVVEPMEVTCHVSPDDGWPVLRDFLGRAEKSLTLGMFDLSAPHIVKKLNVLGEGPNFRFNLAIQRGLAGGNQALTGEKKDDIPEERVVENLREIMEDRFRQAYVDVTGGDRTFASAYHIKVAVRDGQEVWLSSGNMQSTNQPDVQPAADGEETFEPLQRFNREWHVVIKNKTLANTFEKYLLHDLKTAEENPAEPPSPSHELFVPKAWLEPEMDFLEQGGQARYFARKVFARRTNAPVRVQPLLTPDNYLDHVIRLVRSAQNKLFIQNQSLKLLDPVENNEDEFLELWTAIRERQDAGVDLRMIFRVISFDEDEARAIKDRLVKFGFKRDAIRVQERCHTKGVIVDSKVVLLGSHNWTNQGTIANRDASLIFQHPAMARYYERIFLFDWETLTREPKPAPARRSGRRGGEERLELALPGQTPPANAVRMTLRDLLDD